MKIYIEKLRSGSWVVVDTEKSEVEQFKTFDEAREYFLFISGNFAKNNQSQETI